MSETIWTAPRLQRLGTSATTTGEGRRVGIVDDGIDVATAALSDLIDIDASVDHVDGSLPLHGAGSRHATAVAGVVAQAAPEVTLVSHRVGFGADSNTSMFIAALTAQADLDVSNNSWGIATPFGDDAHAAWFAPYLDAIEGAAEGGRGGLGTIWVFAAGNERESGDDVNYHNLKNNPFAIVVAAVDGMDRPASFSTPGAAVLVSAPGVGVTTTDRPGTAGYDDGETARVSGTSFAAPHVSGVAARMLAANPDLGYRDVQEILAYAARPTALDDPGWAANGATDWNGGGLLFHHRMGFGVVDARAAVRLAETWDGGRGFANQAQTIVASREAVPVAIPDGIGAARLTFDVAADLDIDRVAVDLDIDHGWRGDLVVRLVSPGGSESILVDRPGRTPGASGDYGSAVDDIRFTMTTVVPFGERSAGRWELIVEDRAGAYSGTIDAATLTVIGDIATDDHHFVFTDAFAGLSGAERQRIATDDGRDRLNLAAVTTDSIVDLGVGTATIGGRELRFDAGGSLREVFGGDGDDRLAGAAGDEFLFGGRGDDIIDGRAGDDTLVGALGDDTLFGGDGDDVALFAGTRTAYSVDVVDAATIQVRAVAPSVLAWGTDIVSDVEWLQFGDQRHAVADLLSGPIPPPEPTPTPAPVVNAASDLAKLILWYDASRADPGSELAWIADGSGNDHDATAADAGARAVVRNGFDFDGADAYEVPSAAALNTGGPYTGKTLSLVIVAGADVDRPQVVYEQGGGIRGLAVYIADGEIVLNAWNLAENAWGPTAIRATLEPFEQAIVMLDLDATAGTLRGYNNGTLIAEASGIDLLHAHGGAIGVGDSAGTSIDASGAPLHGGFEGALLELAHYDRSLDDAEVAALDAHLQEKWGTAASPLHDPIGELDDLVLWLNDRAPPIDADGDTDADTWRDLSPAGNDASLLQGMPEITEAGVRFDGDDVWGVADASDLNTAPTTRAKSLTMVFMPDEVDTRQILYEQGGGARGLLLAIEDGELVWRGWNRVENPWEAEATSPVVSGRTYVVTAVFDADGNALSLHVDGAERARATAVETLFRHGDDIGIGGLAGATRFADGRVSGDEGLGFRGTIKDLAVQDTAMDAASVATLHAGLIDDVLLT